MTGHPCPGCGGAFDASDAAGHAYIRSSPGCWEVFAALGAELAGSDGGLATDTYAVQHPDGAAEDPRQRQSVAVHLTALALRLERRVPPGRLMRLMADMIDTVPPLLDGGVWPLLRPPARRGATTVLDVYLALPDERPALLQAWAADVWRSWSDCHDTVRGWADTALGAN